MDHEPCLVLLDLMMPVMSGPELLRTLEERHRLANMAVVVLSASNRSLADVPQAKRYIGKPLKLEHLLEVAQEFCGSCAERAHSEFT